MGIENDDNGTPEQASQLRQASFSGERDNRDMTENGDYGQCKPEHLKTLQRLLSVYVPKQRMRKADRDMVKTILSLKQGFDGDKVKCILPDCGKIIDIEHAELHHYDETESHNVIINLGPIHHNCNASMNGKKRESTKRLLADQSRLGSERERDQSRLAQAVAHIGESEKEYSSREGEKHDLMRIRWNGWIQDKINGPFKEGTEKWRPGALAKKAVHALGTGSSVTYRRYVEEDYYGGIFDYELDDAGYKFLRYLGPKKDKTNPV